MKKLTQYFIIGSAALLLTACRTKDENITTEPETSKTTETTLSENESTSSELQSETTSEKATEPQTDSQPLRALDGLTKNEYEDLEITAVVLKRMALLPGSTIPLTVTIKNNGDKTLIYTKGSGSFETPQALLLDVPKLQPIAPTDHLGAATMDMRTGELLPEESLQFTLNIRAIEPTENFIDYTHDRWVKDQTYLGDIEWNDLKESYPDLLPAAAGTYEGSVYFLYTVAGAEGANPLAGSTGYNVGDFTLSITE